MRKVKSCLLGFFILLFAFPLFVKAGADSTQTGKLYIPLGQISNRPFKMYVYGTGLTAAMDPVLTLKGKNKNTSGACKLLDLAEDQSFRIDMEDGEPAFKTGTLMLFDLGSLEISSFAPSIKTVPVLTWTVPETGKVHKIIYPEDYFVGHGKGATVITVLIMMAILIAVSVLLYLRKDKTGERVGDQFFRIICDEDGQVSMALMQMGLWTLAVASMVLGFGLLRLSVPHIPDTLITLMLFAAGTATAGQFQSKIKIREDKKLKAITKEKDDGRKLTFWEKLNTMFYAGRESDYPSIAKIQVLAWTVITLTLFVYMSINEGELWEVPNQLVILMGISQATFLGRQQMAIQDVKREVTDKEKEAKNGNNNDT